jgi:hypothetical protein
MNDEDIETLYSTSQHSYNIMIKHLFLMALISIAVGVSITAAMASCVNIATSALAQNATSGNTTGGNSTESLTTSEERGAYSEYGG